MMKVQKFYKKIELGNDKDLIFLQLGSLFPMAMSHTTTELPHAVRIISWAILIGVAKSFMGFLSEIF